MAEASVALTTFIKQLEQSDKEICEFSGHEWDIAAGEVPPEWGECKITNNIPTLEILRKIGESNGKEHGKRFEENLKIVVSKALSTKFLTKSQSGEIFKFLNDKGKPIKKKYTRKYETIPITDVFL